MNCPYCKKPLYSSDKGLKNLKGVMLDVWECWRDDRKFIVPAGTRSVSKFIHSMEGKQ